MGLSIGSRYVLCMGGADGVDQLAKDLGKHFGMQVDLNTLAANSKPPFCSFWSCQILMCNKLLKTWARLVTCVSSYSVIAKSSVMLQLSMPLENWKRVTNNSEGGTGRMVQMAVDIGLSVCLWHFHPNLVPSFSFLCQWQRRGHPRNQVPPLACQTYPYLKVVPWSVPKSSKKRLRKKPMLCSTIPSVCLRM